MTGLYRGRGLHVYEASHYSQGEHVEEVEELLRACPAPAGRILDLGCSGGLHALELARRGFPVVGVDVEPSAVRLARSRAARAGCGADFFVLDLSRDLLSPLGIFGLVYSLGNVISHVAKACLPDLLARVRGVVAPGGVFLFDALAAAPDFPREVVEEGTEVVWTRTLDRATGQILLDGDFRRHGFRERFQVWGYTAEEMSRALEHAGFRRVEISGRLDFEPPPPGHFSSCLKYRAS
ncbi:MAG: class I SAM-dependent methyltransferase [Deltaproteobacteria bacterium]|nr:class I SAM-dependent methyltransferase [Deltaproteobacteria bacterium]